jgi:hypothetical protein
MLPLVIGELYTCFDAGVENTLHGLARVIQWHFIQEYSQAVIVVVQRSLEGTD